MAPGVVLDVVGELLVSGDVLAGQDLGDGDELALEGVTGELDGLGHGGDVLGVVADTGVEVVVGDGGDIEGIGGLQSHGTGVVAGVRLEDGPGEEVVHSGGVDAVVGEVAAEVDGATEGEDVPVVVLGHGRLVEHVGAETGGGVQAAVSEDGGVVALDAVVGAVSLEGAAVESREVVLDGALDGDLVVILEVGANTGEVDDDGDVELAQLLLRTDTRELEELGRVVGSTSDDDLAAGLDGAGGTLSAGVLGGGLVQILALEELDTGGGGSLGGLVEGDLGDVGVQLDIERVLLGSVGELGVADGDDKLTGTVALAVSGGDGDLEETRVLVTGIGVGVGIAGKEGSQVDDSVGLVAESESGATDQAQKLEIAGDDVDGGVLGAQPSVVAVALAGGEVGVLLELDEVLAHVVRGPGVIASELLDVLEVGLVGVDSDQGVVSCATTKSTGPGVEGTLLDGASGGRQTGVQATIRCLVRGLEVASLPLLIGVVLDEEVPCEVGVLRDLGVEGRHSVVLVGTLVVTSFDQKGLVASEGEASSERTATCSC